jgi:predicted phosphohydrolase
MKLIWCSDVHLNFLDKNSRQEFYEGIKAANGDVVVISGDIAESHNVVSMIKEMETYTNKPVYFVLGNHDFYGSNVSTVKRSVRSLGWLGGKAYVPLSCSTALLGVDGWGDCRLGNFGGSRLTMSDWLYIEDLRKGYGQGRDELKAAIQKLADADARKLRRNVLAAIKDGYNHIVIVTHVPPFEQACLYAGRKSTEDGLPFFASKCLGDAILPIAKKYSDIDFLWLSGHTHSRVTFHPIANMVCKVADAQYYRPKIELVLQMDELT